MNQALKLKIAKKRPLQDYGSLIAAIGILIILSSYSVKSIVVQISWISAVRLRTQLLRVGRQI